MRRPIVQRLGQPKRLRPLKIFSTRKLTCCFKKSTVSLTKRSTPCWRRCSGNRGRLMTIDPSQLGGMDPQAKRELLAQLLRERASGSGEEEFILSLGQEGLWFLNELAPASAAYNVTFCAS